jgi:hypothetical protein
MNNIFKPRLNFKGPFHIEHINDLKLVSKGGVYIWGFMFDLKNSKISNEPIKYKSNKYLNGKEIPDIQDFELNEENLFKGFNCEINDCVFIPYYVGERDDIISRIKSHHDVTNMKNNKDNSALKYARMFISYYKKFYLDFPTLIVGSGNKDIEKLVEKHTKSIQYFNSLKILDIIYPKPNKIINKLLATNLNNALNNNPIDQINLNKKPLFDSLKEIVVNRNNFWFCYAEFEDPKLSEVCDSLFGNKKKNFLQFPEAQTYYALKGKTISRTINFNEISTTKYGLFDLKAEDTCKKLFKRNFEDKIVSLNLFDSYLKDQPYVI